MSPKDLQTRRSFLKALGLALGCQYFALDVLPCPVQKLAAKSSRDKSSKKAPPALPYKIGPWTGDEFDLGHKLRVNDLPKLPEHAERSVDVIIVGGGMAGLTAAYNLKDENFLLLEQYGELGGQSRGSTYKGIAYSYGAAYIGDIDGIYGELYSELSLQAIKLEPDRNQFYYEKQWFTGTQGDENIALYRDFKSLLAESKSIWKDLPENPDPAEFSDQRLQSLDKSPFIDSVSSYSKEFLSLLESFCRSSFGGSLEQISALAGYSLLQDLVIPTYVFKGGNPAIASALAERIMQAGNKRVLKNTFVWKIHLQDKGASVYFSQEDGSLTRVDCKHVIVANAPLVSARQLSGCPDILKAQLMLFKYCSYLVANMLMKEKLFKGAYDCFLGAPYSFADITVAETPYIKSGSYNEEMGSVLTIYQPYPAGSEGRTLLLLGNREKFAADITKQMEGLVPGFLNSLEEVVLSRWGHALAIVGPSYFARLAKIHALEDKLPVSLAHSSLYGWPAAESAIKAGRAAALRARESLRVS